MIPSVLGMLCIRCTFGLFDGLPLDEAARRGNAMGAMATMVNGDVEGLPARADLALFMSGGADDVKEVEGGKK
ncbi:hypothetical protein KEH51_23755 [[Brevibacterium] frigoritolerans]|uniref:Uncharacterized protein n=1 Tax=Peribacillus frigoritolerans TaxID=450367 RepID=A0A941JBM1_9BACI|nr:hypothetical protein [Peribacillus frigoritolerans]